MAKKRLNSRHTTSAIHDSGHINLVTDIIISAILVVSGRCAVDSEKEVLEARVFLQSEKCQRWAMFVGVDID